MALSSWGTILGSLFLFSYVRVATCLAIPALTARRAVPPKFNPFLTTSLAATAQTSRAVSTAELGEKDTRHANGVSTASSLTDFQEFVRRRESRVRKVLLDLRPWGEFCRGHAVGATSVPVDELELRLLELPPPFALPVDIMGNEEVGARIRCCSRRLYRDLSTKALHRETNHSQHGLTLVTRLTSLEEKLGYMRSSGAMSVKIDLTFDRTTPVSKSSVVYQEISLPSGNLQELRLARELLTNKGWRIDTEIVSGASNTCSNGGWSRTEVGPRSVQVWRANDFLEFCMERYLMPFASERGPRLGPVLDLGCGSGRDTVYMAQHLPLGTRVIGVDNHSYALERGAILADKWVDAAQRLGDSAIEDEELSLNVGPQGNNERRACEWLLTDLRKPGSLGDLKAHVIHGHRFKCEQMLPLLRDQVLLPGGFFIWSTFLDTGAENAVPPWRPSRMLRPGELADLFSGDDFEIFVDEHGELSTRGSVVPANFFACRKRPDVEQPSP